MSEACTPNACGGTLRSNSQKTHRLVQLSEPDLQPDLGRLGHQVQTLLNLEHELVERGLQASKVRVEDEGLMFEGFGL